jgi:hypothetical protein
VSLWFEFPPLVDCLPSTAPMTTRVIVISFEVVLYTSCVPSLAHCLSTSLRLGRSLACKVWLAMHGKILSGRELMNGRKQGREEGSGGYLKRGDCGWEMKSWKVFGSSINHTFPRSQTQTIRGSCTG